MPARLTPEQRVLRAKIAINTRWARVREAERAEVNRQLRTAFMARFLREADPDGTLPEDERLRRAQGLMRVHMQRMAYASSRARAARKARKQAPAGEATPA